MLYKVAATYKDFSYLLRLTEPMREKMEHVGASEAVDVFFLRDAIFTFACSMPILFVKDTPGQSHVLLKFKNSLVYWGIKVVANDELENQLAELLEVEAAKYHFLLDLPQVTDSAELQRRFRKMQGKRPQGELDEKLY